MMNTTLGKVLLSSFILLANQVHGASVDWLLSSHAAFRADGAGLDFGLERVPGAAVQMQTGRLIVDMPELTLKGERGLNLTISRSHGKISTGYHSLASWGLESPRLVLVTAPSTKLRGDSMPEGICAHTGDFSNGGSGSQYTFTTTATGAYAAELSKQITTQIINQTNKEFAERILSSIILSVDYSGLPLAALHPVSSNNRSNANSAIHAITQNIAATLSAYTNSIDTDNKEDEIKVLRDSAKSSLVDLYNNGFKIKIRKKNGNHQTFSTSSELTGVLNENFFFNYTIENQGDFLVLNSSGIQVYPTNNPSADAFVTAAYKGPILLHVYASSLLGLKSSASSWVTTNTTNANVYSFENKVDPRKRPVALYLPAEGTRLFYPIDAGITVSGFPEQARYISQDNWFIACGAGTGKGMTVHASNGVRYIFPESNRENQTGYPSAYKASAFPGRVTLFASKMENVNRESYEFEYENLVLGSQPFVGYNNANKILLKAIRHKLDGAVTNNDEPLLKFIYNKFNQGAYSTTYTSGVGDIVLREMQRIRNGNYVTWVKYDYATGQRPSTYAYNTTNDEKSLKLIQDEESSKTYLITASYLNNDVYSYSYGGPYNITGNFPSVTGQPLSSPQGYLWFFSDLTGITYRRMKPDNSLATGYTATWTYTSSSLVTPGQDEAKSYRVSQSTYTGTGEPTYTVGYTYVQAAANQQRITVTLPGGKVRNYWFHHYTKGINENALHGYLSGIDDSTRSQRFTWQPSVVIGKKPASGTSYEDSAMENVSRLRQSATSITHHGTYGTSILTFDSYDNPLSLTETGINGSSSISRTVTQTYFNADPLQVNQGTDWWILGLKTAVTSNGKSLWQSTYDKQGAMTYKIEKGTRTDFSYTGVSFSSCIPSLASFSWGSFISCVGNYLFGNYHTGLVYEENTGLGLQITKYAAHKKGIAQRIRLPNGAEETNEVDDYGNITNHVNADGIASSSTYDDAGLMTTTTPVMGLASTTISRNGFTVSQVTTAGSTTTFSTTETWSGFGRKLSSASTSGGRTLYIKYEYDASGRLLKETFPSDNSNPTVGLVYGYDVFDRVTSATNGTAVESYCYQSCGSDVGSLVKITNSLGDQVVVKSYYSLGSFSPTLNSRTEQRGTDASSLTTQVNYDPDWLAPVSSKRGKSEQTYIYNASGRLQSISDNASGTITVTYDAAGRVKTRTYPGSLVETIQYQGLGDLVKSRTLSGGAGTMTYAYTNGGRLTKATSPHAILNLSYDAYKRPTQLKQTITLPNEANRVYTVKYGYNTMSQVVSIAYPGGKTIDLSNQNAFGHVLGIPGIANTLSYDAFGNLTSFQQGSIGWNRSYTADGRLQGITLSTPVGCHYNTSYQYDSLNRINKIVDNCNTNDAVSSITRWGTGQIKTVTGSIFSQQLGNTGTYSYAYDHDDIISITKTAGLSSPVTMTYAYQNAGASPRLDNITATPYVMSYDATGRVVSDGTSTFSYDGFGRLLGQADSQSSNQFFYAADNLRVAAKTTTGTAIQEIDYFYGLSGNLLYEINRTTQLAKHYVYAGGQLLATLESYPDTDSDNDGMADEEEIELGLNPMMAGDTTIDSDNDGLPDWQERLWGLNPHNPDTDGDGARDGYEYERLGLAAALDPARKPQQSEEAYRRCKGTKAPCWLIPVTSLLL